MAKKIVGEGKVVVINGSAGVRINGGMVWYVEQDLDDLEGEIVKVQITCLGKPKDQQVGFRSK